MLCCLRLYALSNVRGVNIKEPVMSRTAYYACTIAILVFWTSAVHSAAHDESGPQVDKRAETVLRDTAGFYQKLKKFGLNLSFSAMVQAPGVRREMWANYDIKVARPNKVAFLLEDGAGPTLVSDGSTLSLYLPSIQKFSQREAPADFASLFSQDEAVMVNKGIGNMLLVDSLLKKNVYGALLDGVSEVKYSGEEMLDDQKTHHLSFEQPGMTTELWIQAGTEPWVRKASVDMSRPLAEALPQSKDMKMTVTVKYDEWQKNNITDEAFAFSAPAHARKVTDLFSDDNQSPLIGKPAPQMKLDLLKGGKLNLDDHKGKHVVVLEFWASWCAPCIVSLPIISEVTQRFEKQGVVLYAINQNEEPEVVDAFLKKKNMQFAVGLDHAGKMGESLGLTGIPLTIVIGKDGTIQSVHTGLTPNFKEKLTEELETLVAGKSLLKQSL